MMKKVMALLMAALLMLALAGCGENKNNTNRVGQHDGEPRCQRHRHVAANAGQWLCP